MNFKIITIYLQNHFIKLMNVKLNVMLNKNSELRFCRIYVMKNNFRRFQVSEVSIVTNYFAFTHK